MKELEVKDGYTTGYNELKFSFGVESHYLIANSSNNANSETEGSVYWGESKGVPNATTDWSVTLDGYLVSKDFGYIWWNDDLSSGQLKNSVRNQNASIGDAKKDNNDASAGKPKVKLVTENIKQCEEDENSTEGAIPTVYTSNDEEGKEKFSGHKGFFVNVNGGVLNIEGTVLKDFVTDNSVNDTAPIYAHGGNVTMTSGLIENNTVGYTATDDMANKTADELKDMFKGDQLTRTDTAGAMILTGGATGSISGGTIKNNKADTGAIVVAGANNDSKYEGNATTFEITGTTDIYHNTGVHHAGAVYVYNGADVTMTGGRIADNFAWYKGGGVWVSEEAYNTTKFMQVGSTKYVGDASFTMDGGEIARNTATCRAGAIEVESNHVTLLNGTLSNNYSRELGGAIYVEGDAEDHMYQLYIKEGHIHDNVASVDGNINSSLNNKNAKSNHPLISDKDETNTGDYNDYNGYQGYGGGVWLCAFGGNATIDASDSVIINNNSADTKGQDLKLRPTSRNAGSAVNILEAAPGAAGSVSSWMDERNNSSIELGKSYTGPLPITNNDKASTAGGLQIYNNVARVGGGIAANGTVVFGVKDVELFRLRTQFDIAKDWDVTPEEGTNANFVISIQDKDGNKIGESYEVALNGKADAEEGVAIENEAVYESAAWVASFGIPLTVTTNDGSVVPVFTFDYEGKILDPSNIEDQKTIYELITAGKLTKDNAKLGEWKINIEESVSGTSNTYTMTKDDVSLNKAEAEVTRESTITDKGGHELAKITEKTIKLSFAQDVHNKKNEEPVEEDG